MYKTLKINEIIKDNPLETKIKKKLSFYLGSSETIRCTSLLISEWRDSPIVIIKLQ